jgi:uncharacterized OB-fold protein
MYDLHKSSPMQHYVDHAQKGELAYQVGPDGHALSYPRVLEPGKGSDHLEWRISKGLGTVYSRTVIHNRDKPPHNVVLVDLDEGFRIMSRVDGAAPEDVTIGMRVKMRMISEPGNEFPFPVFDPLDPK